MNKIFAVLNGFSFPLKNRFWIWSASLLAAGCLCPSALASPDAGVTNGNVVTFQGNQSGGVNLSVSPSGPSTLIVSNLLSTIAPPGLLAGVQITGTETNRNLTAIVNDDVSISTSAFIGGYGIYAANSGGSAGGYTPAPTNFVISSQLVGTTNFVLIGSYTLPPNTFTTTITTNNNVYTVVTTTNVSGSFDTSPNGLVPSGGVTVINRGTITTSGILSHGIFAQSLPGTLTFQNVDLAYGDGGPVNVLNSGNITTLGFGSHGIFAQSVGGYGPENSPTSGNGVGVSVTTAGGIITTAGNSSDGIFAQSIGGNNIGGESGGSGGDGNNGGAGGDGGTVSVTGFGTITNKADNSVGIFALSQAGNGGNGGNGGSVYGSGGSGGSGGKGSDVTVNGNWNIETFGTNSSGIVAQSLGGHGGSGGDGSHFVDLGGGNGGGTGDGGNVTVLSAGNIHTHGTNSLGIFARSLGGFAGNGGDSYNPFYGNAGDGNSAGAGRDVIVGNTGNITTDKDASQAIYAESVGGGGGSAGSSGALVSLGSSGGAGGNAGNVAVTNSGTLWTFGAGSHGIEAQSIGGGGGDGGNAAGLVALGGSGNTASTGQVVRVVNTGFISTSGSNSYAILAQSIGGGGGNAGSSSGAAALGASGGGGGDGGAVHVSNTAALQATGQKSMGIFAQSLGGGGGNGGDSGGIVPIGGDGGTASQGDVVTVFNSGSILSSANAIFAQSIGGGGGNGGSSEGWFSVGGSGAGGGNGAAVTVNNLGALQTTEFNSSAMLVQSVGGGGGNGGSAIGVGVFGSLAIGGNGGAGGSGGDVIATSGTNTIVTLGDNSYGIDAESVGGGGGNGGYAIAASVGKGISAAVAIGGHAGGGGNAGSVTVTSDSIINTFGTNSHGIFAQSIGGGGGVGGFSIAFAGGSDSAIALSMGGDGGGGGNGGIVNVTNTGAITTSSQHAYGILAQSVGGGGGDGGFAIAGAVAPSSGVSASLAFGGSGATGGVARAVSLMNVGNVTTIGDDSGAILAQSVGGGGGSGGFSIAGAAAGGSLAASFGGSGGGAGQADTVSLFNAGNLMTLGDRSDGITAQSIGGGGGNGGFAIAGSLSKSAALSLGFGGSGGFGATGGNVIATNTGAITTLGNDSRGIIAQSVGGGGGNGGFSIAGSFTQGSQSVSASLSFGGNGSTGGVASAVSVWNSGAIETFGTNADAILAQSVGGGGGAGGFAGAAAFGAGSNSTQVAVSVGGTGGLGNLAGAVTVNNSAQLFTHGNDSIGILAQSVGGGGGDGGMAVAGTFSKGDSQNASLALGGNGGAGGDASTVNVDALGNIFTTGDRAHGILAQSVGGGGGNGGLAIAVDFSLGTTGRVNQYAISLGGSGNDGGKGGNVFLNGSNVIMTAGQDAYGVFAQSVGGGGGSGGFSLAATGVFGANQGTNRALTLAIGGDGGDGNIGGSVLVNRSGTIETMGDGSYGIVAQSIGGGGGDGGGARSFSLFTRGGGGEGNEAKNKTSSKSINISIGGSAGNGSSGGEVTITNAGDIITHGADAYGILAQSVGGGGGTGGNGHSSTDDLLPIPIPGIDDLISKALTVDADALQIVVGGNGGSNGFGSHVIVNDTGAINTFGDGSYGIFAQSVGGGGGAAGNGTIGKDGQLGIGGAGGSSGDGGQVDVIHTGNILTAGAGSAGIFAQSVGGGGGVAGNVDRGLKDAGINIGDGFAFGRDGGSAGNGSAVNITNVGEITTGGTGAYGIFAQSVGGGGGLVGDLGNNIPVLSSITDYAGSVGHSGSGGDVTISQDGNITTYGTNSTAIFAQSAGGTNGVGGNITINLTGSVRAYGLDADGIYAQSGGGATVVTPPIPTAPNAVSQDTPINGNVLVTIATNTVVQGGTGNGVGVRFMDGVNNSLINYGVVTTVGSLTGTAVSGTAGNERIDNYGQIAGSVDLGGGGNAFNNMAGGTLFAGSTINVGAGNLLANFGTVSLGDADNMQVTALNGNFLQSSNGSLQVKLASTATYDALNSSGSATLDGNLSVFRFNNYLPTKGNTFTVLSATNIAGQFASLSDPYAGNYALRLETLYTSTNVTLQVVQDSFLTFAHTGNQNAVSKNLNSLSGLGTTGGDPRAASLVAFLDTQDASQLPHDLDQISPDELGAMFDLDFAAINLQSQNIHQRMSEIRSGNRWGSGSLSSFDTHGGNFVQIASAGHELPHISDTTKSDKGWGVFAAGNGQYVDINGSTNAAGYHFESAGVTLGADTMLSDNFGLGFTLDYASTKASLVENGSVDVDGGRGGVYATWFNTNSYLEASFGGGYNHYSTKRTGLGGNATGSTDGFNVDALIGGGYDLRCNHFIIGPQGNLHYSYVRANGFTETGSMAPLKLQDNDSASLLTQFGAHTAYEWYLRKVLVRPELAVAWQHESMDDKRSIDSRLASGAGSIFTVHSPSFGRDSLALDVGLTVRWSHSISTFLAYHGDYLRQNYTSQSGSGGFSVTF